MENLIVYIYKDEESLKYDIKSSLSNVKFLDTSNLDFKDFKKLHLTSLVESDKINCFYGIKYKQELLLDLLDNIEKRVIWCFTSLPKNRKLYKQLNSLVNIKESVSISKPKDKESFIKNLCKEHSIPVNYLDIINLNTSESKFNIENEIIKLSSALKQCKGDKALDILSNYSSDSDLFNLCIHILSNKNKAISYFNKIVNSKVPVNYIYSMVNKRLFYYLYLSLDNEKEAKSFWKGSTYFINKDKQLAKEYGFYNILQLIKNLSTCVSTTLADSEYDYLNFSNFIAGL